MSEGLIGCRVELCTPDERVFRFVVRSLQLHEGQTYAVLEEEKPEGQLLVTHVETDAEGAPVFIVEGDEDIITAVLEKQVAEQIMASISYAQAEEEDETEE